MKAEGPPWIACYKITDIYTDAETKTEVDIENNVIIPRWSKRTAFGNSLDACYQFYTKKPPLKKETRNIFVKGNKILKPMIMFSPTSSETWLPYFRV